MKFFTKAIMRRYSKFAPNSPMVMNGKLPTEKDRGSVRILFFTRKLFRCASIS